MLGLFLGFVVVGLGMGALIYYFNNIPLVSYFLYFFSFILVYMPLQRALLCFLYSTHLVKSYWHLVNIL